MRKRPTRSCSSDFPAGLVAPVEIVVDGRRHRSDGRRRASQRADRRARRRTGVFGPADGDDRTTPATSPWSRCR